MNYVSKKNKINLKNKYRSIRFFTYLVLALCVLCVLYLYIVPRMLHRDANVDEVRVQNNQSLLRDQKPYVVSDLSQKYESSVFGFSVNIPKDFTSREFDSGNSHTIVFENMNKNTQNEGVQIIISPYDEKGVKILTKEMIQNAIPEMRILDDQILEIGNSYKGLAFKSDNDAFDKDSREVWFIFRDNLYQISTYSRLDELLKQMFNTWEFK